MISTAIIIYVMQVSLRQHNSNNFPLNHYDSIITGSRTPIVETPLQAQIILKLHSNHSNRGPAVQKTMSLANVFFLLLFANITLSSTPKLRGADCHKGLCLPSKVFEKYLLLGSRVRIILYIGRLLFAVRPHTLRGGKGSFFSIFCVTVVKL